MIIPVCPECETPFLGDDINVAKDVAYCRKCGVAYSLSGLVEDANDAGGVLDLDRPPKGAWFRKDMFGVKMGAQHRPWSSFGGIMFFTLFWNGITSFFVVLAIGETLKHLSIALPNWFPMLGNESGGMFGKSFNALVFFWLFLTPFICIGIGTLVGALMCLFCKIKITIQSGVGRISTKVWGIGWTRKFEPEQLAEIDTLHEGVNDSSSRDFVFLQQKSGKKIKFGSMLSDEQRTFFVYALRRVCKV
jgi:hypothetical protein